MNNKNITGYLYKLAIKSWEKGEREKLEVLRHLVYFIEGPKKCRLFCHWKDNLNIEATMCNKKRRNFAIELKEKIKKIYPELE